MLAQLPAGTLTDMFGGHHWPDRPARIWERRLGFIPWPVPQVQQCVPCGSSTYTECSRRSDVRPARCDAGP